MSASRSVVATCFICKEKYFEPEPKTHKQRRCGHCQAIRRIALDGTAESLRKIEKYERAQKAKNILKRPRVADVLMDLSNDP